jgi:hypothetical protein
MQKTTKLLVGSAEKSKMENPPSPLALDAKLRVATCLVALTLEKQPFPITPTR